MIYVLNALVPPFSGLGLMKVSPSSIEEVKRAVELGAKCYIGHPATASLLGVPVSRGEARPVDGDVAYVLRLRFRTQQSGAEVSVNPQDLEVLRVEYLSVDALHALSVQGVK